MPSARFSLLLLVLLPGSVLAQDEPRVYTYSYSNLFDGGISRSAGFTTFDMVQAVEEAFSLWSQVVPLSFLERPDSGPAPSDDEYLPERYPVIRIGHHGIEPANRLGHAFSPGPGGLESDMHFDSSNRTWDERLFLSTAVHELGHTIGLDHIDGEVAIMNSSIGGPNLLPGLGQGYLFPADIAAAQQSLGVGSGTVTTQRSWSGAESSDWGVHANWQEGFRPTKNTQVMMQSDGAARLASDEFARSVTMGGGSNSLQITPQGSLTVHGDVTLGTRDGGNLIVAQGAAVRTLVPQDATIHDDWFAADFDDSQWSEGATGIGFERSTGFEDFILSDLEADMYNHNASVYSRIEFNLDDPSQLDFLRLRMRYDDGFVAYLNGIEVASANRPATLRWNSRATGLHSDTDAIEYVDFPIDSALASLQQGRNLLAIQGLNYTVNSSDMLISPEIVSGHIQQELTVDGQMTVAGDLALAQDARSSSQVTVGDGALTIRGNVTVGVGQSEINLRGGVLQVQGDSTPTIAVARGAVARTLVPTDGRLGVDWTTRGFDDSNWSSGPTGIGFELNEGFADLISTDLSEELYQQNASFYARIRFDVTDVTDVAEMLLQMRFDDGFIAYLNGTEIARENAPEEPQWNSQATRGVDDRQARERRQFDVSRHANLLTDGTNVLAIQGLNQSPTSRDALLLPELSFRNIGGTLNVGQLNFFGGQLRDVVRVNGQFNHHQGMFSPSRPGSAGGDPGSIEINGPYLMDEEAVLEMNIDGLMPDQHDSLHLLEGGTLNGTLSIVVNASGGDYKDPTEPGESQRIELLIGTNITGEFATMLFEGETLEGHHGSGLFRHVVFDDVGVSLLNYQAFAGDANGDGRFDSADFIQVFQAGQYEDSISSNSDWTTGDWNGDLEFASNDLVAALQTGRYVRDSAAAISIPEPTALSLLTIGLVFFRCSRRRTL